MNSNRRVFFLVIFSVGLLLLVSIAYLFLDFRWTPFARINLVADVMKPMPSDSSSVPVVPDSIVPAITVEEKPAEDFTLYKNPHLVTDFKSDTTRSSLPGFTAKLYSLKSGQPAKIRIAYFGDSMIEGDLLTQTLRQLLQQTFGGNGVGFVPITSQVSQFRQTVRASYSDGWEEENFKEGNSSRLYLSGHLYKTENAWVKMTDQTIRDSSAIIEKSLICGNIPSTATITVNKQRFNLNAPGSLNRIVLNADRSPTINIGIANKSIPLYGVSFESASGIFVDNFSFRGITGIEFAGIDSVFLSAIAQNNPYDLIIFQYGVNLLFRPKDKDFNWYARAMMPIIRKLRNCFEGTDFLLVSTADRAFRYDGEYKSAIGIDSLVKMQAMMAYRSGCAFYNQFATMGGTNSIVEWAKLKPPLANQDYVHPNHRGAELLARYLYESLMTEYQEHASLLQSKPFPESNK